VEVVRIFSVTLDFTKQLHLIVSASSEVGRMHA
jgi:hypothetical protein